MQDQRTFTLIANADDMRCVNNSSFWYYRQFGSRSCGYTQKLRECEYVDRREVIANLTSQRVREHVLYLRTRLIEQLSEGCGYRGYEFGACT